jgi:DNA ligase (NAD+)
MLKQQAAWLRVSPYLDQAMDLEPSERPGWLGQLGQSDPEIAQTVRALLNEIEALNDKGCMQRSPVDVIGLDVLMPELERMGDKSAKNVYDSIQVSRERTLDRLLCGLGIPQIGQVAARQLAEAAGTLETLLGWSEEQIREHVGGIRGFGPKMVDCVVQFMADPAQRGVMRKLVSLGVGRPQPREAVATTGPLVGTSFCVTGVLSKKREDVHALLRAAGAEIHDGVKKNTTYLVAGDKTGKSKLDQAKKFGTRVVTEAEMNALLDPTA